MLTYHYYSDWGVYSLQYRVENRGKMIYPLTIDEDLSFIAQNLNMGYSELLGICNSFNGNITSVNTVFFTNRDDIEYCIITLNILK